MSNVKKKSHKKERLIALLISLVLLGIVIAAAFIYQNYRNVQFEPVTMIIGNIVGFALIYAIVYHFVKKPDNDENKP